MLLSVSERSERMRAFRESGIIGTRQFRNNNFTVGFFTVLLLALGIWGVSEHGGKDDPFAVVWYVLFMVVGAAGACYSVFNHWSYLRARRLEDASASPEAAEMIATLHHRGNPRTRAIGGVILLTGGIWGLIRDVPEKRPAAFAFSVFLVLVGVVGVVPIARSIWGRHRPRKLDAGESGTLSRPALVVGIEVPPVARSVWRLVTYRRSAYASSEVR